MCGKFTKNLDVVASFTKSDFSIMFRCSLLYESIVFLEQERCNAQCITSTGQLNAKITSMVLKRNWLVLPVL